ncbi:MAG: hypothetical protein HOY76_15110 [Streptomyces sp.]|nr:hypothetical protein [Streptomyces sp.]NUR91849.1 hypothetical protein [Nonomuraea sp.]
MNVRRTGLVAGMAVALTLAGSGAVSASASASAADPCANTSTTCSPADVAKEAQGEKPQGKEFDRKPGCSAEKSDKYGKQPHEITPEAIAKALAAELGVGYDRALRAVKELDALNEQGRVDPESPGFRAVARHLGVSPKRLIQALRNVKRSLAESGKG